MVYWLIIVGFLQPSAWVPENSCKQHNRSISRACHVITHAQYARGVDLMNSNRNYMHERQTSYLNCRLFKIIIVINVSVALITKEILKISRLKEPLQSWCRVPQIKLFTDVLGSNPVPFITA